MQDKTFIETHAAEQLGGIDFSADASAGSTHHGLARPVDHTVLLDARASTQAAISALRP